MTFWGGSGSGSGSADPCLWLMDPDSDPDPDPGSGSCYFGHWPSRWKQKTKFFNTIFSAYYFLKLNLHHFSKIKSQIKSQNSRNQGFSQYFCTMIEGSGSGSRAGSGPGSIPLTSWSGSGSGRPKNMWIRWIRIRIRNTAGEATHFIWTLPGEAILFIWTLPGVEGRLGRCCGRRVWRMSSVRLRPHLRKGCGPPRAEHRSRYHQGYASRSVSNWVHSYASIRLFQYSHTNKVYYLFSLHDFFTTVTVLHRAAWFIINKKKNKVET